MILERQGYAVLEAHDGDEAISLLRQRIPDLVLLDVMMPGQDGFEVLKEVRALSNVPVIMLPAQASEADRVRGLDLGADDYIPKPFGHRELVSRVKAALFCIGIDRDGVWPRCRATPCRAAAITTCKLWLRDRSMMCGW